MNLTKYFFQHSATAVSSASTSKPSPIGTGPSYGTVAPFSSGSSASNQQTSGSPVMDLLYQQRLRCLLYILASIIMSILGSVGTEWIFYLVIYCLGFHSHGVANGYHAATYIDKPDWFLGKYLHSGGVDIEAVEARLWPHQLLLQS